MSRPVLLSILFVSLALNVFGLGAFVGSRSKVEHPVSASTEPASDRRDRNPVAAAVRTLSPPAQTAWRAQTPEFFAAQGANLREARRLTRAALMGLGANPLNPTAAKLDLERARDLEHRNRLAMDDRLVAFAATLSPEDRARFADALARSRGDRPPPQAAAPVRD